MNAFQDSLIAILQFLSAAVADFTPEEVQEQKIKKDGNGSDFET